MKSGHVRALHRCSDRLAKGIFFHVLLSIVRGTGRRRWRLSNLMVTNHGVAVSSAQVYDGSKPLRGYG